MRSPVVNEFQLTVPSTADGTRPATAFGTAVTPGTTNAYGSYASLGVLSATEDMHEIDLCINSIAISATATDTLVTLGVDPAGGTSFTDLITDILCSCAGPYLGAVPGGVWFRFRIKIKAGSTIGLKASQNAAAPAAFSAFAIGRGQPSKRELVGAGTYADTFGVTSASSSGTTIVPGTTSEGAWTQIGSALTRSLKWLEFGYGINDSTMTTNGIHVDIAVGDASNKRIVISNALVMTTVNEQLGKAIAGVPCNAAVGDILYARAQCGAGSPDSLNSIVIIGIGG